MTIHTADGDQKITKLDCIGKRAKYSPDTVFNNIWYVLDLDLLRESYRMLDAKKATGIDGVTKAAYGVKLGENLANLLARLQRNAYKPQASRLVEIPKEDGTTRPLAISCLEDKIVQMAVARILTAIHEPIFLPCSYGFREGINAHEALRALMKHSNKNPDGVTIEIDLKKYFNSIPHDHLQGILREKISDKRFLKLVEKLIRSPILVEGKPELNKIGCPQGSVISPILANIYLHHVMDSWFDRIKRSHLKGRADMVRYADDMVFVFQYKEDADKFYRALPNRLEKYGLTLHLEKSSVIRSGSKAALEAAKQGKRLTTYKFLGFTCYWGLSRDRSWWRLKFRSRTDRRTTKLNGLRKYLGERLNQETYETIDMVIKIVRGWINYHAISDNQQCVNGFILQSKRMLLLDVLTFRQS